MNSSFRIIFTLTLLIGVATAQWGKKPYHEWTEKEALRVLDDSPWGQTQAFTDSTTSSGGPARNGDADRAIDQGGSRVSYISQINFRIRFLSARPVREAISRLMEIRDRQNSPEFKARLKDFVTEESPDYVVVAVLCDSPHPTAKLQRAMGMLGGLSAEKLKGKAYLATSDGRRAPIEDYQPPGRDSVGARFFFPRIIDGKPLVTDDRGEIRFYAELSDEYKLDRNYKIKNMTYEGRLEY
ncbi:MAG TPA: hypothetical protein VID27_19425 [Blastocatellia bacterium]